MPSMKKTSQVFPVSVGRFKKTTFRPALTTVSQERLIGRGGFGQIVEIEDPKKKNETILLKRFFADRRTIRGRGVMRHIHEELRKVDPDETYFGGLFLQQGELYMTMHDHGVSLEMMSRRGMLDKREIVLRLYNNFPTLVSGLELLHSRGWIHGDVKASNILVSDSFHLRFIDYDLTGEESAYRYTASNDLIFPRSSLKRFYYIWPWERWYQNKEQCFMWDEDNFHKGMRGYFDVGLFNTTRDADIAALLIGVMNRGRWARQTPRAPPEWVVRMIHAHTSGKGYVDYDDLFEYIGSTPINVSLFRDILPSFFFNIVEYYTSHRGRVDKLHVEEIDTFGLGLVAHECFVARNRIRFLPSREEMRARHMVEMMLHPDPTKRSMPRIRPSKETAGKK